MTLPVTGFVQQVEIVVGGTLPRAGFVQPVEIQGGGGGFVTGTGTPNRVAKFTAASVIGDGLLDFPNATTIVPTSDAAISFGTTSLRFVSMTISSFFESTDGSGAGLSGAATGRIRYNNTAGAWQISVQGGAYANIGTGSGSVGPAVAGQVGFFTAATSVGGDTGLTYSSVNKAITVGVARFHSTGTRNTFVGEAAGNFTLTGTDNASEGFNSLNALTTGSNNSAFGAGSMDVTTTGGTNSAFGFSTLGSNTSGSSNSAFGTLALGSNTTANNNCAFGANALTTVSTSGNNCAFGVNALLVDTTGSENCAFGNGALDANTTGAQNCAFGQDALGANTTASNGTAFGFNALLLNTGVANSAFGATALDANTTGSGNSAFGLNALGANDTGGNNCAFGSQSLAANTGGAQNCAFGNGTLSSVLVGTSNCAFGHNSLLANTGTSNSAFGNQCLDANTTGNSNSSFGSSALGANTTGSTNCAFGSDALATNSTASDNCAFGSGSLQTNATGTNLCAFGKFALFAATGSGGSAFGSGALGSVSTGADNTGVGRNAGNSITTGAQNSFLGATANASSSTISNSTAIGFGASVGASNTMVFGNASVTVVLPGAHNAIDLGSTGVRWKDGWFQGNVTVAGKLTVVGAIDPTSVSLSGGTALFFESNDGSTAPVSGGAGGRIRYNNTTGTWQASTQGGAYANLTTGGVSGSGANTQVVFWTGTSSVSGSASFTWDNANSAATINSIRIFSGPGVNNMFIGNSAGNFLPFSSNNTGVGVSSLLGVTFGTGNCAFGVNTLTANDGGANCAFGTNALLSNTSANFNCAFGSQSLDANTTGTRNCGFGRDSLGAITTANDCSAFGHSSLLLATGANNCAFGSTAGDAITTGTGNCVFGQNALGVASTGADSVAVGRNAGLTLTTGGTCTFLGATADTSLATAANSTALGFGASVSASNQMVFGNGSVTVVQPGSSNGADLGAAAALWKNVYWGTQALAPAGSVSAPSISFAAETGSGMWRRGAGAVSFSISGSEVMEISATSLYFGDVTTNIYALIGLTSASIKMASGGALGWTNSATDATAASDVILVRDAAAILALKDSTTAQKFRVYGSTTGPAYIQMDHDGSNGAITTVTGNITMAPSGFGGSWTFNTAGALKAQANVDFAIGTSALATNATSGFLMIQSCAGPPTGTPGTIPTGQIPIVYDSANDKLYIYRSGWKKGQVAGVDVIYA